jgi:OmcA/MtrC family decaheme c-type cytochrome
LPKVGDAASSTAGDTRLIASVKVATTGTETFDALNLALSPFVTPGAAYGLGFAWNSNTGLLTNEAAGTTVVLSPISAACSGCHDSATAVAHMKANGGTVFGPRTTALANTEQCLICHGPGKTADIKAVHRWK